MHGTLPKLKWTDRDEATLQRELEGRAFWQASLEASINATTCREGERSRTERRLLIARADAEIARLIARKRQAMEAA
jgi:hypothetical protein